MKKRYKIIFLIVIILISLITTIGIRLYYNKKMLNSNNAKYELVNIEHEYSQKDLIKDEANEQRDINLWKEGNIPTKTNYIKNDKDYFDEPNFMPYITEYYVPNETKIKGAILINPGGAFRYRAEKSEGIEVAKELSKLGYKCFVVHYRLKPYTTQEGALDLARAVRYVRSNSKVYEIDKNNIAIIGFSAGGMLCGEEILNFDGLVNGTSIDKSYIPDEIDNISADVKAVGFIYSYYGKLSKSFTDVELFKKSNLPPAFFAYGTKDFYYSRINDCINALRKAGVPTEAHIFKNAPHAFGVGNNNSKWINDFDKWLSNIFNV